MSVASAAAHNNTPPPGKENLISYHKNVWVSLNIYTYIYFFICFSPRRQRLVPLSRLQLLTKGCQTTEMTLRRNALGQLGFHVNFEGIVAEVEPYGYAWQAGLRQGSRLVEICKVSVASLSHEQMIDLLRTSVTVKVVIIPPHDDSTPRR